MAGSGSSIRRTGTPSSTSPRARRARRPRRRRATAASTTSPRFGVGHVYRIAYTGSHAPTITTHPASQTVSVGDPATFTCVGERQPAARLPVAAERHQHPRCDVVELHARRRRSRPTTAPASGSWCRTDSGTATSNEATLTVTANQPPTATITAPAAGTTYGGGETIAYSGTGTDPRGRDARRRPLHLAHRLPPRRPHPPVPALDERSNVGLVHRRRPATRSRTSGTGST